MKLYIKKVIPAVFIRWYHWSLSYLGAFLYGFPSQKIIVVGVTGTNGKSTTVNLISQVLEEAGYQVGLCSTYRYKVGKEEWINETKITMPGRFRLQKLLNQMVKAGCNYAVIETSSEGIKQYRHKNINYDVSVFTNLTPEHIESHGSFENYKQAKGKLFQSFGRRKEFGGIKIQKVSVVNLDDQHSDFFLNFPADQKYGYGIKKQEAGGRKLDRIIRAQKVQLEVSGVRFTVQDQKFQLKLLGKFNVYNALAVITVGISQGIDWEKIKKTLEKITEIPGRMEVIDEGQNFTVIVDYAHEPAGLESVYKIITSFPHQKIISVLGSQGGGRDKQKRPVLGQLAGKYTDHIIVTNEDPYNDDPQEIIDDVANGISPIANRPVEKILDRRQAIKRAINLAQERDIVIITGKGAEKNMVVTGGKKIPWDDRKTVRELLLDRRDTRGL